ASLMESVAILAASSLAAYGFVAATSKLQVAATRRKRMLPRALEQQQCPPEAELRLLVVHIRAASLPPTFDGAEVKIRAKHGAVGVSSACDTAAVRVHRELAFRSRVPSRPVVAHFDTSFVFLWQGDQDPSLGILRIRLVRGSHGGRVVAKATVPLYGDAVGQQEFDLQLTGSPGLFAVEAWQEVVGHVDVATEIYKMSKGDLRQHLERLHAQRRQGAFVLAEVPVTHGEVKDPSRESEQEEDEEDQDAVMMGLPVGR
ncbi:unnamed protein product, partial [Prorocentrum cordatum]